jgi:Zn-dependent oligopeptidase
LRKSKLSALPTFSRAKTQQWKNAAASNKGRCLFDTQTYARIQRSHIQEAAFSESASSATTGGGLFGVKGLKTAQDFPRLATEAVAEVENLVALVANCKASGQMRGRTLVAILDQISDTICLVMDAAELCRSAHPDTEWKHGAMAAYDLLAQLVARLNMDKNLYDALACCIRRAADPARGTEDELEEEELRVAQLLKDDLERGGVHLDDAGRDRVMSLQEEIGQVAFEFVDSSSAGPPAKVQLSAAVARTLPPELQERITWVASTGAQQDVAELNVTADVYHLVMSHVPTEQVRAFASPPTRRNSSCNTCAAARLEQAHTATHTHHLS